jgi:hypothetical protein
VKLRDLGPKVAQVVMGVMFSRITHRNVGKVLSYFAELREDLQYLLWEILFFGTIKTSRGFTSSGER